MAKRRSPGEGSLVRYAGKRGGVWRMKYVDEQGRQRMETIGAERDGMNKTEARERLEARLVEVRSRRKSGRSKPGDVPTFGDYRETWLAQETVNRALAASSETAYRESLNRLAPFFDGMRLDEIRRRHAKEYAAFARTVPHARGKGRGYGNRTIGYDLGRLTDVLDSAVDDELLELNQLQGVDHPKVLERAWRVLRPEEVGPVYRAFADAWAATMFLALILTGLRRMELLGLRWRDVKLTDPEGPYLHVAKSKSAAGLRDIAIPPALADALFEHRSRSNFQGEDELVFAHPTKGTRLNPNWYADRFRVACKKAGITDYVRPFHDLRHSAITNLALEARNAATLQQTAGHANISTTQHYVRLAGQRFPDEAAALERRYGLTLAVEE